MCAHARETRAPDLNKIQNLADAPIYMSSERAKVHMIKIRVIVFSTLSSKPTLTCYVIFLQSVQNRFFGKFAFFASRFFGTSSAPLMLLLTYKKPHKFGYLFKASNTCSD